MKAIVHIGMPKTGSSSIQSWLQLNKRALAAKGIGYDQITPSGYKPDRAHNGVAIIQSEANDQSFWNPNLLLRQRLTSRKKQTAFAKAYGAELRRVLAEQECDTFVLTSEALAGMVKYPDLMASFSQWLDAHFDESHFVLYFRRQEDWIVSSYSQRIRRKSTKTLEKTISEDAEQNWFKIAKGWRDHVGAENLSVRLLEQDQLKDGDLIADFADIIGITPEQTAAAPSENASLSAAAAEYLRVSNSMIPRLQPGGKKLNPLRRKIKTALDKQDLGLPKLKLGAEDIDHIRAVNKASNERLRAMFFPERAELFPPKPHSEATRATPEDVAKVAVDLLQTFVANDDKPHERAGGIAPKARLSFANLLRGRRA